MGFSITPFGGVLDMEQLPVWVGITMIVVVSTYNLIDGIDGLAGVVAAIAWATVSFPIVCILYGWGCHIWCN